MSPLRCYLLTLFSLVAQDTIFSVTVNDTNPMAFYCSQVSHCQNGMVGVVNPSDNSTVESYLSAAAKVAAAVSPAFAFGGIVGSASESSSESSATSTATGTASSSAASTATESSATSTSTDAASSGGDGIYGGGPSTSNGVMIVLGTALLTALMA